MALISSSFARPMISSESCTIDLFRYAGQLCPQVQVNSVCSLAFLLIMDPPVWMALVSVVDIFLSFTVDFLSVYEEVCFFKEIFMFLLYNKILLVRSTLLFELYNDTFSQLLQFHCRFSFVYVSS